ncbi:envoplakin-like [Girardinichthys multiradiatus]|uniref:envoplakin-like n=1 Tax=Girardinichthys multiradiatus TaxID=208333 RepID=UPI001FAD8B59|nr:envoplakin-like [Girardinichthys multiradiatus]
MSKKNEYSPAKINKREAVELSSVISRMQKNADQVEKNILRAEELLGVDKAQDEKSKQLLHQQENSRNLSQAEELLKDLFLDVGKARKLKHPQASEIEKDVKNLHDRWAKNCTIYRDLYDQVQDLELKQKIDWGPVLREKQSHIMGEEYGPNLCDVEKQIAEHNILHQQIEAYSSQLQPSSTTSPENYKAFKEEYVKLLEISKLRHNHLASLYEYMQSCSKELVYLSSQQEKILNRDWSDRMVDTSGVRMEYEKFKSNGLLAHEREVNQLLEEGENLVQMKHPGCPAIIMLRDKVQLEWQSFLNLCIAQEMHLENVDNYKKFQLDADTLSESLQRLNSTLDPKFLNSKSNSEILLALEGDEPSVKRNEQRVEALRELSSIVAPLKLRRIQPTKPTIALSLCDWADENGSVERGVELILKSNPDNKYWELEDSNGRTTSLPGACFEIPPPNPEALETMKSLDRKLADLKKRRSALRDSLKASTVEVIRPQKAALIESAPEDPKLTELNSDIDKINKALARNEKEILNRLRTSLDTRAPIQDLEKRQQENEKSALTVRKLESDKSAIQREVDPILVKKPLGPKASMLPPKFSDANNKIHNINTLIDLYNKKVTASMFLEKQLEKTEVTVSWFEQQLTKDGVILDQPDVLQSRTKKLQNLQQDVLPKKEELNKLGKDLDLTKQACSTLQQSHDEYCPDMRRQESQVKLLKNRYTNINNQLQERLTLLKQASYKNQEFNNVVQSLDFFLLNLPDNSIKPTDGLGEIKTKENSQKRVMEDIQKRSGDIARLKNLSKDLQRVLNQYEIKSKTYRGTLNDDDDEEDNENGEDETYKTTASKKRLTSTLAQDVQRTEKDLLNRFSEISAENNQRISQLGTAKNIVAMSKEKVSQVAVNHQLQLQSQQKNLVESDSLKKKLDEEMNRRLHSENNLETYQKRFLSLKHRRGVERLEEKDVVQYYREPKLEAELQSLKHRIQEEEFSRSRIKSEIELINEKIVTVELQLTKVEPKLVTKVLTEYERDPKLDKEAAEIRDEMERIRMELQKRETETVHVKTELTVLAQQKPKIREKVVKKEVVRLEKEPEMLKAVLTFQGDIAEEELRCKSLSDIIFSTRSQINTLERIIPSIEPKIVTKVVKQVQQDPELIGDSKKIRMALEEEKDENAILMKDLATLQLRFSELELMKPKVEVKEIVNEIYRVDPDTEVELVRLKKELQNLSRNRSDLEKEIDSVTTTLTTLRTQKPKVEYKEVTQEVIKEEKSPEVMRELQRLNNQVSRLQVNYDTTLELLTHLRKERNELKAEKSKVETKLLTKEVIKYENDPLLEKEADRLQRDVREEIHQRRRLEEFFFELQNQYITLERQKPEQKIVTQEVVRLQKDPKQILEHEKLNKTLDEEMKARRKLELEVRQLRALIEEKERDLAKMDDRQKMIQIESELRQIKARILELENAPPPVEEKIIIEEVLKVEKDPKLEKLIDGIRFEMEKESNNISRFEREIRNLKLKLEILQREKSVEKVVYREVVRVEKDPAVEAERDHLRDIVAQERNQRRNLEDSLQSINNQINHVQTSRSVTSQEETVLITSRDALQREKEDLLKQLKALESDRQSTTITFQQQSKLMSERNQMARQRSLKTSSEIQRLEKDILNEKDKIHQRETLIAELKKGIKSDDHSEIHREINLSTKITILDPETGKDLSPYDAYLQGVIDRNYYLQLSQLECDWEEITSTSPDGDITVLQDRQSGRQYSVKDALKEGRLTQYDLVRYKEGKIPVSEFALLVAGERPQPYVAPKSTSKPIPSSPLNSMPSPLKSSYTNLSTQRSSSSLNNLTLPTGDDSFPISGIFDTTTDTRMSVRSALTRKFVDPDTAMRLLEAQSATGGIVDLGKKDKLSVHKAVDHGLIDSGHMQKLLSAQKAFTGVEDPVTKQRLAVGLAAQKGYMTKENAKRYMEAQYLTGGLVDPSKAGRLTIKEALAANLIDSTMANELKDEALHSKELVDPITKEKISYKQAMDRCKRDVTTGLLLLPVASTDAANAPSYSNYRFL